MMKYIYVVPLFLTVLFAACDDGRQQRLQLEELERMNRADSVMTNDSLARDLADWFDRHGTPNEQLRAYYMLGRTHADRGEYPQALEAYNDAADRADTTITDCDYHTLCRVYSQMAVVFNEQGLVDDNLRSLERSIAYAYKDNDTIAALNSYAHRATVFEQLQLTDSIITICENTYQAFCKLGYPDKASRYYAMAAEGYLTKGLLSDAKRCMDVYERESGYFDVIGDIEQGRESYYHIKGGYFLATLHHDSADFYFRKELTVGKDFNNQYLGSQGLYRLYSQTHQLDSALKYAVYSKAMSDSILYQKEVTKIKRIQAIYDYGRYQRMAQQEKERASHEAYKVRMLVLAIMALAIVCGIFIRYLQQKRKREYSAYLEKESELERVQTEVLLLRSYETKLDNLLQEKEEKLESLKQELFQYQQKYHLYEEYDSEEKLRKSPVIQKLQKIADKGAKLTDEEWHEINLMVFEILPHFYQQITSKQYLLNINEYRTAILVRLHFNNKAISNMIGVSSPYISKLTGKLTEKLFKIKGDINLLEELTSRMC